MIYCYNLMTSNISVIYLLLIYVFLPYNNLLIYFNHISNDIYIYMIILYIYNQYIFLLHTYDLYICFCCISITYIYLCYVPMTYHETTYISTIYQWYIAIYQWPTVDPEIFVTKNEIFVNQVDTTIFVP